MPKQTLLGLTQRILTKLGSDSVNSIDDTIEAKQVAKIVRRCYGDILAETELAHQGELLHLEEAADSAHPTMLKIPDLVSRIEWINYGEGTEETVSYLVTPLQMSWGDGGTANGYSDGLVFGENEGEISSTDFFGYTISTIVSNTFDGEFLDFDFTISSTTAAAPQDLFTSLIIETANGEVELLAADASFDTFDVDVNGTQMFFTEWNWDNAGIQWVLEPSYLVTPT